VTVRRDPPPQTAVSRWVSLAALMFAVLAPVLFVMIFLLPGIGFETGRTFLPFAIAATALGLAASIWAIVLPRSRAVGVTTLFIVVPCAFLAAIGVISLVSG
jgi:hypothetical protein